MKVRNLAVSGVRNWPPVWTGLGHDRKVLRGEIGVLADAYSNNEAETAIFVIIRIEEQKFLGVLLFSDCSHYKSILSLLQANVGRSIREIAELEI